MSELSENGMPGGCLPECVLPGCGLPENGLPMHPRSYLVILGYEAAKKRSFGVMIYLLSWQLYNKELKRFSYSNLNDPMTCQH